MQSRWVNQNPHHFMPLVTCVPGRGGGRNVEQQERERFVGVLVAVEPKARRNAALPGYSMYIYPNDRKNRCLESGEPGGARTELLLGRRPGAEEEKLRLEKGRRQSLVILGFFTLIFTHMSQRSWQIALCSNLYTLSFRWWRWAFLPPLSFRSQM